MTFITPTPTVYIKLLRSRAATKIPKKSENMKMHPRDVVKMICITADPQNATIF